jgi:hypothetical protein
VLVAGCATSHHRDDPESSALPPSEVQPRGEEASAMTGLQSELPAPADASAPPAPPAPPVPESLEEQTIAAPAVSPDPEELARAEYEGERAPPTPANPCKEELATDSMPMLDETRRILEETTCSAALWADSLFGEKGDIEAARKVHGHVEISGAYSQFEGSKFRFRMDVRAELPSLKHRLNAFIGRDNENDFLRDRSEGFALRSQFPRLDDRESWLGGLGYALPETDRFRSEFRVGVHGLGPPQLFVQWRTRLNIYADERNVFYVRMTPFWNTDDGVGLTGNFDWSHVLSATRLLRLSTAATRSQKTEGIDWRSAVIYYQSLREGRAVALENFVRGSTKAAEPLGEYGMRVVYREPIFMQRLYVETIIGYSWPRNDPSLPRDGSFGTGVSIDMPFGKT